MAVVPESITVKINDELRDAIDEIRNRVYRERDELVSFLSRLYPSHLAVASDATEGWNYVVCVHGPTGQMTWHIPDEESGKTGKVGLFSHLTIYKNDWDGATSNEVYRRLRGINL